MRVLTSWLIRPFERMAAARALTPGLLGLVLTAFLAWRAGLVTDGVIDLHFGPVVPWWHLLAQGLINWLSLATLLWLTGRWLSKASFRSLDLFATQALARWPMLLAVLWMSIPVVRQEIQRLTVELMQAIPEDPSQVIAPAEYLLDAIWLLLITLPVLAAIVWMVWLMYHAYALVTNLSGQRAVFSFVGAVIGAEILSKVLIYRLV